MASFSQLFRKIGSSNNNLHLPIINENTNTFSSYLSSAGQAAKKKAYMAWFKGIPELTALASKVAKDIVYKYHFEDINPNNSGRNKILNANKFAIEVSLRKTMLSQMVDALITGEAFGWVGKLSETDITKKANSILKKYNLNKHETKEIVDGIIDTTGIDEDLLRPRKYRYIASTSMEILYDKYDILRYKQNVAGNEEYFTPKEIIKYELMEVDGKVNGFTHVESILVQLELLRQMWQNMSSLHKNGGVPDYLFILKNIQPNSVAYKRIKEQIQKYKLAENKHGNMVMTGDIGVESLQQLDKMQFMDSGLYITGLIAMQWGIPRSSIPFIVGGANTKDDTGGNSEKGYWRFIDMAQMAFAETMNQQLWIPYFGVKIVFDNTMVQQDIQEQTYRMNQLTNLQTKNTLLSSIGMKLNKNVLLRELQITSEDVEELSEEDKMLKFGNQNNSVIGTDKQQSNSDINDSDLKKQKNNKKKKDENNRIEMVGSKPTGVSKELNKFGEWTKEIDKEYKETIIGSDSEVVDLNTFVKIYNQDKAYHPGMSPRVFIRKNPQYVTLKFKSSDFVYKTVLTVEEYDANQVAVMNLNGNTYLL